MNFLISGDSWSQGEWINNTITHRGLHQYLLNDGHTVINVGLPGIDNIIAWGQVLTAVWSGIDHVVFFYTDSLRHAKIINFEKNLPSEIVEQHAKWFIDQVKNLKQQFPELKITVIGGAGCFPIDHNGAFDYLIPSMTELLLPQWQDSPYMTSHKDTFEFFLNSSKFSPTAEQKQEFIEIMDKCQLKLDFWKSNSNYFPDGAHPNREGHLKLLETLYTTWA
jgi:hypothetical protein